MSASEVLAGSEKWHVEHADALTFMGSLPNDCVDSLVTDPPAGIGFMGRDWDKNKGDRDRWVAWLEKIMREAFRVMKPGAHGLVWALPRTSHWTGYALENAGFEIRDCIQHAFGSGFPKSLNVSKAIDAAAGAEREVVGSYEIQGTSAMSTEEKGGTYSSGVASSGHRKTIEITAAATDAAKQWEGWGTALKPSHEDWWLIRKPLAGTVAESVQEYGTGALNVDGCRVASAGETPAADRRETARKTGNAPMSGELAAETEARGKIGRRGSAEVYMAERPSEQIGRWPPNLLLSHSVECVRTGTKSVKANPTWDTPNRECLPGFTGSETSPVVHGDGRAEQIETWDCADDCPVRLMDRQSGDSPSGGRTGTYGKNMGILHRDSQVGRAVNPCAADTGTASRFFPQFAVEADDLDAFMYAAKPSRSERDAGLEHFRARSGGETTGREDDSDGTHSPRAGAGRNGGAHNVHPTVKGVAFIRYLQRLITPPGGVTLDIFTGSGTHGVAAFREGFRFLGCELNDTDEEPFVSIARARITHAEGRTFIPRESLRNPDPPKQASLF